MSSPIRASSRRADLAAVRSAGLPPELERILLLEERGHDAFVQRFQQTTPPVHAKGVEDTAFYRWNRLVALNEVGGDPARFSLSVDEFHRSEPRAGGAVPAPPPLDDDPRREAQRRHAGANRRARLVAEEWAERVRRWHDLTGGLEDPREEYLVYQTLVGAWPIEAAAARSAISRRRSARRR